MKVKPSTDTSVRTSECIKPVESYRSKKNISFILQFVILLVFINCILTTLAFFVQFRYFESKHSELELRLNSFKQDASEPVVARARAKRQQKPTENTTTTDNLDLQSFSQDQVLVIYLLLF